MAGNKKFIFQELSTDILNGFFLKLFIISPFSNNFVPLSITDDLLAGDGGWSCAEVEFKYDLAADYFQSHVINLHRRKPALIIVYIANSLTNGKQIDIILNEERWIQRIITDLNRSKWLITN